MDNNLKQISLYGAPLFTWYELQAPINQRLVLPSESCFAYILDGEEQDLTKTGFLAKKGTVILSLCGKTVSRTLSKMDTGYLNAIVVHFNRNILKKIFDNEKPKFWKELEHPLKKDTFQEAASVLVQSYFLSISTFFNHKNALNEDILSIKLKEIILLLLQTEESSNLNTIIRSLFSEKTFSFKEVIEANLYEPLDLHRLAAMTNNSLASFKRKFNNIYNNSPARYIRHKKLDRAKNILASSQNSISEICYECGFSTPSSFSRIFKAEYNMSPSAYRLSFNAQ